MKKTIALVAAAALALCLAGCGGEASSSSDEGPDTTKKITLGAASDWSGATVQAAQDSIEEAGYEVDIKLFDDYTLVDEALADGSLDVNMYQYPTYLDEFNADKGTDLVMVEPLIINMPNALFAKDFDSIDDIPDGATCVMMNDANNRSVALRMLDDAGIITLSDEPLDGKFFDVSDIVDNPKNIEFVQTDYWGMDAMLSSGDVDLAASDLYYQSLYPEHSDIYDNPLYTFINDDTTIGMTVRPEDADAQWVKDLNVALRSEQTQENFAEATGITDAYFVED